MLLLEDDPNIWTAPLPVLVAIAGGWHFSWCARERCPQTYCASHAAWTSRQRPGPLVEGGVGLDVRDRERERGERQDHHGHVETQDESQAAAVVSR